MAVNPFIGDPLLPDGVVLTNIDYYGARKLIVNNVIGDIYSHRRTLTVSHPDAYDYARDVSDMMVSGAGLNPWYNPKFSAAEPGWMPYQPSIPIMLAGGFGTKTFTVQLRFRSGEIIGSTVTTQVVDVSKPRIYILRQPPKKMMGYSAHDIPYIAWACSHPFTQYAVTLINDMQDPYTNGYSIGVANGSINVAASGSWLATNVIQSRIALLDFYYAQANNPLPYDFTIGRMQLVKVFALTAFGWTM